MALQSKGITDLELASLEEILTGIDAFELIGEGTEVLSESGCCAQVFEAVRPSLTAALAERAAGGDSRAVADRWAETDELVGAAVEILEDFLVHLSNLAARGVTDGRSLYVWVSV